MLRTYKTNSCLLTEQIDSTYTFYASTSLSRLPPSSFRGHSNNAQARHPAEEARQPASGSAWGVSPGVGGRFWLALSHRRVVRIARAVHQPIAHARFLPDLRLAPQ